MIPGDQVKMRAAFLRSTGQYTGEDAHATFTVVVCDCWMCKDGEYIAVDQRTPLLARRRHINVANVIEVSKLHLEPN